MVNFFNKYATRSNNEYFKNICKSVIDLLSKLKFDSSIYYYSTYFDVYKQFRNDSDRFDSDPSQLIILVITDYLSDKGAQFNLNLLEQYYKKTFLILTNVFNAQSDYLRIPENVHFIHMGPDWCHSENSYTCLSLQNKLNDGTGIHWINLNRHIRHHRILTGCYLLGQDLGVNTDFRGSVIFPTLKKFNFNFDNDFENNGFQSLIDEHKYLIFKSGWDKLTNNLHYVSDLRDEELKIINTLKNAENYDRYLRKYYDTTVLEIVSETLFYVNSIFPTEKTLHSVHAMNFPIIISSPGIINYLNNHGFDIFDDVIDHSYDSIGSDINRLTKAIDGNVELINEPLKIRSKWFQNRHRFENNIQWAKGPMYKYFHDLTIKEVLKFLKL